MIRLVIIDLVRDIGAAVGLRVSNAFSALGGREGVSRADDATEGRAFRGWFRTAGEQFERGRNRVTE